MSWSMRFREPIPLPSSGSLKTLSDARAYVLALPESEQAETLWQTAAEMLLKAASRPTERLWIDFSRIAVMQALYPKQPPEARQKRVKAYRIIQ